MRLVFMGTPDFAVPALNAVCDAGHDVAAVFTQPDKPRGRGMELTAPPVKLCALERGLPVFQPSSMKDETVWRQLEELRPDCIVVVAYGKLLPKTVLECAPNGCINVHSSLLPKYRGAAPINWAILCGESVTGVSTMRLDEGMDTGDILLQKETAIGENETAGELHDRLSLMGAELLIDTLELAEKGELSQVRQDDTFASRAPMLDREMAVIDWTQNARTIHNKIRGLQPWPVATTTLEGKRLKLYGSRIAEGSGGCGEVIKLSPLTISCGEGAVAILELQGDGSRRMTAEEYMRGHTISLGAIMK